MEEADGIILMALKDLECDVAHVHSVDEMDGKRIFECVDLGYVHDIGYHTILYGSVSDVRQLFCFLIELLPKDAGSEQVAEKNTLDDFRRQLRSTLRFELDKPLLPWGLNYLVVSRCIDLQKMAKNGWVTLEKVFVQGSSTGLDQKLRETTLSVLPPKQQKDIEKSSEEYLADILKYENSLAVNAKTIAELKQIVESEEDDLRDQERLLALLNAPEDLEQLKENVFSLTATVEALRLEKSKLQETSKQSHTVQTEDLEEAQRLAESQRENAALTEMLHSQMRLLHELKKGLNINHVCQNRSTYTLRILEITENIKKQKLEIAKIIGDIKLLQKDINLISGKLERTFVETENRLLKYPDTDQFKNLITSTHEQCARIIRIIEDNYHIRRDNKDLEDQILLEKSRLNKEAAEKLYRDYKELCLENQALAAQLGEYQKEPVKAV
ncbi:unnamed protein product [Soboliphyme baturini]|uniref:Coiled-coil domain-containing protein 22 homolog n=1 Tax=Soboliphyme baturini TaxID=241478 RepID=A0A183IM54_9BILA|nr:unnamed protein product [Soboliphyme baturini]